MPTYGKRRKAACSPHQTQETDLKAIVPDDLLRVMHFARMKERQFAQYITQKNTAELRREINRLQKELGFTMSCPHCSSGSMRTMFWGG